MRCKAFKNRIIKIALLAAMAVSVAMAPMLQMHLAPAVSAASSLDELQQRQEDIRRQQEETNAKIDSLKADQAQQEEYKKALDEQLANVKQEKYVIQERINVLDAQISEKQAAIAESQQEIDHNFDQLGQRIKAIYLAGETTTLEVLLHAGSATELMDNMEVVQSITDHDRKLIEQLQAAIASIKDEKAQIEASRDEVAAAKLELDKKQDEINALVEESNRILEELNANIEAEHQHLHALDEQSAEAAAAVDQWFADYYAQQSQNSGAVSGGAGSGAIINGGTSTSGWMFPAPGTYGLTSDFSDGRNHGAWDIATGGCSGNPIVAAKAGRVVNVNTDSWGGGYGTYAFVDHGGGYITVYAHMSARIVNVGDYVEQGQVLGYIGTTGQSTGPHLHFEIRYMGVKQDPYNYYSDIYGSLTKYF